MKKILIAVIILVIAGAGYYAYTQGWLAGSAGTVSDRNAKYFMDEVVRLGVADVGQPIEGFDYTILTMAFPGLLPDDFNGVATVEGRYEFSGNTLTFVRNPSNMISSAERAVSEEGYKKLLENLSARLKIEARNKAGTDEIINKINVDND
ncbi:hypothetical protein A3B18_02050 [Candidatus Giovannonibacteria bacterium RIFCSPLOWO2_01_FULL_46_13]|uniref:Uncharacterized protein n=1 Tax=Candidatus Giovannonibacteria bacterium RIFCSPLOWO2_01_FULL_46_13 TaxID=1798352 RepID=A0A1F5X669_9BACT|nr:MAG: hypothetical protein A3B18_02050 [Candidatus Giovannonibacteria bacterium RIFCSPLOWO2_01_FULL_46_13]